MRKEVPLKGAYLFTKYDVERVSKISVTKMIMYLKAKKHNIRAFKQISGRSWILTYQRKTITFANNRAIFNFLLPFFNREQEKDYRAYLERRNARDAITAQNTGSKLQTEEPQPIRGAEHNIASIRFRFTKT